MFFPVIPLNTQPFSRISGKFYTKKSVRHADFFCGRTGW